MELSKRRPVVVAALIALIASVLALVPVLAQDAAAAGPTTFINEIHYDNDGADAGEAIEVAGPAGTDLTGWSVVFYNGNGGTEYGSVALSGVLTDQGGGYGTTSEEFAGIQNGAPDGMALVDDLGAVVQFLSYEGTFDAVGGPADGMTSTDIGVSEGSSTPEGTSMQLTGSGVGADDFTWTTGSTSSFGSPNAGQEFLGDGGEPAAPIVINEIMQNPSAVGDSEGEYFEVFNAGTLDVDMTGWTVKDDDTDSFTIDSTLIVAGGGYAVFGKTDDTAVNGGVTVDYVFADLMFLSNSSDELVLIDTGGVEVDRVNWDNGSTFPDPNGSSMALIDPALDNFVGANWCESGTAFGAGDFGSPGGPNDCFVPPPVDLCVDGVTHTIMEVQGDGDDSPLEGTEVSIEGVVTANFEETPDDDRQSGFWMQDAAGDGNPATSDGIKVFTGSTPSGVAVGDVVRAQGFVDEFFGNTELDADIVQVCGTDVPPEPVTPELPVAEGASLEPFEGMLVSFDTLYVADTFNLHRFQEIDLAGGGPLVNPTNEYLPGDDANAAADRNARSMVTLTTGSDIDFPDTVPYLNANGTVRRNDTVTGLTGPLGFSFGDYRVYNPDVVFEQTNPRPAGPDDVGGVLKVASFNVLNYWTTIDDGSNDARGADSVAELERQTDKLVTAILALESDIVGIQELENNGPTAVGALVDALNAADADPTWAFVPDPVYPGGLESTNAIKVGIIYKSSVATPIGDPLADDDPIFAEDRPPIAQTFEAYGEVFTVVNNHFKSKGSSGATGLDEDQGDGQGAYNFRRTEQAKALKDFIAVLQETSGDDDVLALGDFNAYALEDPIMELQDGLVDLTLGLDPLDKYSLVFFGAQGQLDYAFVTDSLTSLVTGVDIWHINADEPRVLDYNDDVIDPAESDSAFNQPVFDPDTVYRSSDHDPVIVGICETTAPEISATATPDSLWPPNHKYVEVTVDVVASDNAGDVSVVFVSAESNEPEMGLGDRTPNDVIVVDDTTFLLRAERQADGDGRTYTITYEATDTCGNTAVATAEVQVLRSNRQGPPMA